MQDCDYKAALSISKFIMAEEDDILQPEKDILIVQ